MTRIKFIVRAYFVHATAGDFRLLVSSVVVYNTPALPGLLPITAGPVYRRIRLNARPAKTLEKTRSSVAMKICSLLPSGTEILFALGLGEQVVGVSDLCDYPPESLSKPVVCRSKVDPQALSSEQVEEQMHRLLAAGESPYDLDTQWLLQKSPDVVLTQDLC